MDESGIPAGESGRWEFGSADPKRSAVVVSAIKRRRTSLKAALRGEPHPLSVTCVQRPIEVLELLDRRPAIDVLIIDLALPGALGWELLNEVVGRTARPAVVVVLPEGWSEASDDLPCAVLRAGADEVLPGLDQPGWVIQHAVLAAVRRREQSRQLDVERERFALVLMGSNDGAWFWDVRDGSSWFSPRWRELLGLESTTGEDTIERWLGRVHPADIDAVRGALQDHLAGRSTRFELEHRVRDSRGEYRWMAVRAVASRSPEGRALLVGGSMSDITSRRWAEQQLLHDAFHDALTGLPNRPLFLDRLALAMSQPGRLEKQGPAVVVLDVDRFREINEELGPGAGDDLLIAVGIRVQKAVRPEDTVARLGSDEFGVLIPDVRGAADAIKVIDRVGEALEQSVNLGGRELHLAVTFGLVVEEGLAGWGESSRPEDVLRAAEVALYRARSNRSRFEIYDPEMQEAAVSMLRMRSDLRRALDADEFEMFYQPIVSLDHGRITAFEGLVRWHHPERGMLTPQQFIGLAEETGLIVPLGWWVLEQACRQLKQWHDEFPADPPLSMSINVSGRIFLDRRMVDRLLALLESVGVAPEDLRLEVTEKAVLENERRALERLAELRALGVRIAVDDFGVGYSSLAQLYRFSFDELKIDGSLIAAMEQDERAHEMVSAILTLARSLRIGVVSEGVETASQAHLLRDMKCPSGQGFWFARPATVKDAGALLTRGPLW